MKVRKDPRIKTSLVANVRPLDDKKLQKKMLILNISVGGAFIESSTPLPQETLLELEFSIPITSESSVEIHAVGFVSWNRKEHPLSGMGIQFLSLSKDAQKAIKLFTDNDNNVLSGFF